MMMNMSNQESNNQEEPVRQGSFFSRLFNNLASIGLGESLLKVGTNLFSVLAIVTVVLLTRSYFAQAQGNVEQQEQVEGPEGSEIINIESVPAVNVAIDEGISRSAQIHTNIPTRPRDEMSIYVVQEGDTVFGIAEKFGLEPQTILWGNYSLLLDNPHGLRPGQELNILPVNGVYWEWLGGIPFGSWAEFYGVTPADIIEYPANNIDANTVGDYNNANIPVG
ncbi:MAG TPA: hypothetical protein DEP19_08290, partial [Anaerolineae bacterium]|nr:hypothetical protein [Anaerolineae bacterium]